MAQVELTSHLKEIFPVLGQAPFEFDVETVADAVKALDNLAPGVGFYICDELGRLRKHVNVYVDEEMVCDRTALSDRVSKDSRLFIAQALSGG
jgi:sulfur-carrier protein